MFIRILSLPIFLLCSFIPARAGEESLLSQAREYYFQGKLDKAIESYKEAEAYLPQKPEVHLNLALLYRDAARYRKAEKELRKALALSPDSREIKIFLAELLYLMDRLKASERIYQDIAGEDWEKYFGLARVLIARKRFNLAEEVLHKLKEKRPHFAPVYFLLGEISEANKEYRKAIFWYQQALKEDHTMVEIRFNLARNYEKLRETDKAWREYVRILNMDSKNIVARKKEKKLSGLLAKRQEEILSPEKIEKFSSVEPITAPEGIPSIRVGIGVNGRGRPLSRKRVTFKVSSDFRLIDKEEEKVILKGKGGKEYFVEVIEPGSIITGKVGEGGKRRDFHPIHIKPDSSKATIIIQELYSGRGFSWAGKKDHEYRGTIAVLPHSSGLNIINYVNLEEYLYSVLPSEMSSYFPVEALKAQAVIARSVALYRLKYVRPHHRDGYDLCNDQHCQVYQGVKRETEYIRSIIDATRGEYVSYKGKVAHTLYSSNCGGHTQSSDEIGWGKIKYLSAIADGEQGLSYPVSPLTLERWLRGFPPVHCNNRYASPSQFRWARFKSRKEIEERINRIQRIGHIKAIIPLARSRSGHLRSIMVKGTRSSLIIKGDSRLRGLLGIGFLRSSLFVIQTRYRGKMPVGFCFQ